MSSKKIGFWSVLALVTGGQIGSGVFMLPASLAPFGFLGLIAWPISALGAIMLAMVFAQLCTWFPKTGGPHVYVGEAFGKSSAFFTGWTYWLISWISTPIVIASSIGYLTPLIGQHSASVHLALEIILLAAITILNFKGVEAASGVEFILTLLKILPLLVIPCAALFYFDANNLVLVASKSALPTSTLLTQVVLFTLWGFIGLESGTTPADQVENPGRTIPRALILGTSLVALLYFLNALGIMGLIPGETLMHSKAPYADATRTMVGGHWHIVISIIASLVCVGTLNAWTLTSGQIALGLAQDRLLPKIFSRKNKNHSPIVSLSVSSLGITLLLILTANENISHQINTIIDFSVTSFLFIYLICSLAYLKVLFKRREQNFKKVFIALFAASFCLWVILGTPFSTLMIASCFTLSGIPVYWFQAKKRE